MAHIYIIQSNWSEVWPIVAIKDINFFKNFVPVFEIVKLLPQGNKIAISQHQSPKSIKWRHFTLINFQSWREQSAFIFLILGSGAEIWLFCHILANFPQRNMTKWPYLSRGLWKSKFYKKILGFDAYKRGRNIFFDV